MIGIDQSGISQFGSPSAEGICEVGTLMTRCMGDATLAANLLRRFDARLVQVVSDIEWAVTKSNWPEAARKAHSLKGEAGSLATTRLQQAATRFEQCLRSGRTSDVSEHVAALKNSAEQLRQKLPAIVQYLGTPVNDES